jgi:hypothetical protein
MSQCLLVILAFTLLQAISQASNCSYSVVYLPLDERFTTRDAFLNLFKITPWCLRTPEPSLLSSWKTPANLEKLDKWIESAAFGASSMILSAEMYLYGGLIASRISNDSTSAIQSRLKRLWSLSKRNPDVTILLSNVVMRIPSYNGDFEEPWYWADYGEQLYTYSYYTDKFQQQGDPADARTAEQAAAGVPSSAISEFTWRRSRNHNITMEILARRGSGLTPALRYVYTTLDDSAEFGFNIREADQIRNFVNRSRKLDFAICPVYPGADEVQLVQLARLSVDEWKKGSQADPEPLFEVMPVFRDPKNIDAIPSYEGQPMIDTLNQQTAAAGAVLARGFPSGSFLPSFAPSSKSPLGTVTKKALLLVNNFGPSAQKEAADQPDLSALGLSGLSQFAVPFDTPLKLALGVYSGRSIPVGFCDNKYANGGDAYFVKYLLDRLHGSQLARSAYAGWNTNGNTIGTVVANVILLGLFGRHESESDVLHSEVDVANSAFNSLRILEDYHYQAVVRQQVATYVQDWLNSSYTCETSPSNLTADLPFYSRFAFKILQSRYRTLVSSFLLPQLELTEVYYPWNRTFEMGFLSNYDHPAH